MPYSTLLLRGAAARSRRHHQPSRQAQCAERHRHRELGDVAAASSDPSAPSGGDPHRGGTKGVRGGRGYQRDQQRRVRWTARPAHSPGRRSFAPSSGEQAGDRRDQRICPGRRLRAGHGLPPARRQRRRRSSGSPKSSWACCPGYGGDRAAAQDRGPRPGAGAAAHRRASSTLGGVPHRPGQPGRARGPAAGGEREPLRTILENGPLAVRACLEAVDAGLDIGLDEALLLEANLFGLLSGTADMREGTAAFGEKRKASFRGE